MTHFVSENIEKDDYIEGYEYFGSDIQRVRGWVDNVFVQEAYVSYSIQADDKFHGARGTAVTSNLGPITKLEPKERF